MVQKAPGKAHRKGITLFELQEMFPDELAARKWFEELLWPDGTRHCPRCGSMDTHECSHAKMPYRCRDCRKYFSIKTGTVMAGSPLPLLKWVYAIYLDTTSLKGVSSMKLHRDLGITQKTAWFMQQRIREAFARQGADDEFEGPVEVDETYVGGKRRNMSNAKRKALKEAGAGRGAVGKAAVVGVKDRESNKVPAKAVESTDAQTLIPFVESKAADGSTIYTDGTSAYRSLPTAFNGYTHESVNHSVSEYVRGEAHTNGIESFWSMLKRAHKGTFHKLSPKHLDRHVQEFAGRHNIREMSTLRQMAFVACGMSGRFLPYEKLIADNGLPSFARP
jgi:transposase-like protein